MRRLKDTVHLETRCDGAGHNGCQAGCLLYWKHQWLKETNGSPDGIDAVAAVPAVPLEDCQNTGCTEDDVFRLTQIRDLSGGSPTYVCQATQVHCATDSLAWWDLRQYFEDYWSGNVGLKRIVDGLIYSAYFHLSQSGLGLGPVMRWFYNKFHSVWGGTLFPRMAGRVPVGKPTPSAVLNLQPGELVRVKSHDKILETVDASNKNRGMYWDAELVPYCGGTYQVLTRVTKLIDEKTAKLVEMKTPCIILEGVVCQARYSPCRMLCPKSMYPYWREIWLERVAEDASSSGRGDGSHEGNL
jgi:hypothetical protein